MARPLGTLPCIAVPTYLKEVVLQEVGGKLAWAVKGRVF